MTSERRRSPHLLFLAVALAISAAGALVAARVSAPAWIGGLLGLNAATLFLYMYDKRAARHGRLRVPEAVLHLLAVLGGSLAALLSQVVFRHKTSKRLFRALTWVIVGFQAAVLAILWYGSRPGSGFPRVLGGGR